MKNILFLGDYFPHLSINSLRNYNITKQLFTAGFNIYFLSDAWCKVGKHSFIKYMPEESRHITESYYVDPVQVQYSNLNIALIALAKSICLHNEIKFIYISDILNYGIIAETLNSYFEIPIITTLYADHAVYAIYEIYTKTWFNSYINKSKYLFTHTHLLPLYEKYKNKAVITDVFPYHYHRMKKIEICGNMVIIGGFQNLSNIDYFVSRINDIAHEVDVKLLIGCEYRDKVMRLIRGNSKIEFVSLENGIEVFDSLSGYIALSTEYLFDENVVLADQALLLLCCGFYPVVNKNTYSLLKKYYASDFINYNENFFLLRSINVPAGKNTCNYHMEG